MIFGADFPKEIRCMLLLQDGDCELGCDIYQDGACEYPLQFVEQIIEENDKDDIKHYNENYGDILYDYAQQKYKGI